MTVVMPILHFFLGVLTMLVGYVNPIHSLVFAALNLTYEINEDAWVKDKGYLDIKTYFMGYATACSVALVLKSAL
jgi:hypothetical protein